MAAVHSCVLSLLMMFVLAYVASEWLLSLVVLQAGQ